MKIILTAATLLMSLPALSQTNLTGIWRLQESNVIDGARYSNAIPISISIAHDSNTVVFESISDLGGKDTVTKEVLAYGKHFGSTKAGKKKITSFDIIVNDIGWVKTIEIFTSEDSTKLLSVDKTKFQLSPDGNVMSVLRKYDALNDLAANSDFVISGTYERLTPEQLRKETDTGKGVQFAEGLSWEEIKAKAKRENKAIFVDCYATWCAPCKAMDKYVYPLNMIGDVVNSDFISLKVQMDSTDKDDPSVKRLYPLARKLEKEYNITALPTYLFFSSSGKPLHKDVGQKKAHLFLKLIEAAKDPNNQIYGLVERAKNRQLPWSDYSKLVNRLRQEFGEKRLAEKIASLYYHRHVARLDLTSLMTKANLDFIGSNLRIVRSSDKIFHLCLTQHRSVDSVKQEEDWAEFVVEQTIIREDIKPVLAKAEKKGNQPGWEKLIKKVSKKYNKKLATKFVLGERVGWHWKRQEWAFLLRFMKSYLDLQDLNKVSPDYLHWYTWFVFKHSDDTSSMNEALVMIDMLIGKWEKSGLWAPMDTKACLLYKLGRREEGIAIMKKLTEMFPQFNYSFEPRLKRMNAGEEIWLTFN